MSSIVRAWGVSLCLLTAACRPSGEVAGAIGPTSVAHLADHLDRASVASGPAPATSVARSWSFAEPRPEWRVMGSAELPRLAETTLAPTGEGLRMTIARPRQQQGPMFIGGIATDLPDLPLADIEAVHVRARSRERLAGITVSYDLASPEGIPVDDLFFLGTDEAPPVFSDGSAQVYSIPLRPHAGAVPGVALASLGVFVASPAPGSIEILSVELVPRGASFEGTTGARSLLRGGEVRTTLWARTPASLAYRVALPKAARLDLGFAVSSGDRVSYRVKAREGGGDWSELAQVTTEDSNAWSQRSIDLAQYGERTIELALEAESERPGAVALWGAPIVSGGASAHPNVVFYVIDGGGADLMSVYGYNRRTTPFLEELAREGVVFERAHSNASWTQPSTASFMTSLHHSVLGGLSRGMHSTPVPAGAPTFAGEMRRGGYATASFTTNPNSGRMIGVDRGVDVLRDLDDGPHSTSSAQLHRRFFDFRASYPAEPYWAHFQTTDVHEPNEPVPPFAGLFVSPADRDRLHEMEGRMWQAGGAEFGTTAIATLYEHGLDAAGIDRQEFYNLRRGLYDETMAYQDAELRRFVGRLKANGEWERTILVVTADHGHPAGTFARFGRGMVEPQPEPWQGALADSYLTHVPLIVVWSGTIAGDRRIPEPVSLVDVLPTVLDLAGLPPLEVTQGESLAPLLRGQPQKVRPVVLDEFRVDESTGEMIGNLEIVDGRWGASLEIGPLAPGADPTRGRHAIPAGGRWGAVHPFYPEAPRLLLYDLESDPFALHAVNDGHPELVDRYTRQLLELWKAHRALATRFGPAADTPLSPEQLQQLKALGYIQ